MFRNFHTLEGLLFIALVTCYPATHGIELSKQKRVFAEGKASDSHEGFVPGKRGYEVRSDGAVRITDCLSTVSCQNPAFSPDGTEIIFTRFLHGYNKGPSEIVRLEFTAFRQQVIVRADEYDHVNVPGSSWRKRLITYASDASVSGNEEIFITDKYGKTTSQITAHKDSVAFIEPSFSTEGTEIVFEKDVCPIPNCEKNDLARGSIWVVELSNKTLKQIAGDKESDYRLPNWSPTTNKILFQKRNYPLESDADPVWDIWTMDGDGSNPVNVTNSAGYDTDASWSGDGSYIVYSSDYSGLEHPNIYIISSSGGQSVIGFFISRDLFERFIGKVYDPDTTSR